MSERREMPLDTPVGVFGHREAAEAFTPTLDEKGIRHRWEENHAGRMLLLTAKPDAKRAETAMHRYLGVDEHGRQNADQMGRGGAGCLLLLLISLLAAGCAHHLRIENVRHREEPHGDEIFVESEPLILYPAATPFELHLFLEREMLVEQDMRVITEADEVILPWSFRAVPQFLLMSWNPIAWPFTGLYHERQGSDHGALCDWLLMWNPFIRTGGPQRVDRRVVDLEEVIERRRYEPQRLPLNETSVDLVLRAGGAEERLTRTTDQRGNIVIPFETLPPAMRSSRPLRILASVEGRGTAEAQLW